jgi:hypothetical protein
MRVEHNQGVKAMSDQELEAAIEVVKAMLEQRAGEAAKVIAAVPDPIPTLPDPSRKPRRKRGAEAKASPLLPDEQGANSSPASPNPRLQSRSTLTPWPLMAS